MKLIKSFMLLTVCMSANNFLFAQQEPAIAPRPVEVKLAMVPDSKPNPAIISKQQNPAELKNADTQNTAPVTYKEDDVKPQVMPAKNLVVQPSSTDIIFPDPPLPKPIIKSMEAAPAPAATPNQVPVNKRAKVLQTPQESN